MALTESDIAQVLEAVKAESKSVESLETVGSLSGSNPCLRRKVTNW